MDQFPILESKEFIFIIGAPRSGTTMLQIILGSHPDVATTVELSLFSRYLGPWFQTWSEEVANIRDKGWNQGLPFIMEEPEFMNFARLFLDRCYAKVAARKPGATHLLDKHPGYSKRVETMRRLLPKARFLHIIRDGRDTALSMVSAQRKLGFGASTVTGAARAWKTFVLAARKASAFGPDYLEVRYEDLLARGVEAYAEVLEFCRLPAKRAWIGETLAANSFEKMRDRQASADVRVKAPQAHYRLGEPGGWRAEFGIRERIDFDKNAGDLLCELGYAERDWWIEQPLDRVRGWLHGVRHSAI